MKFKNLIFVLIFLKILAFDLTLTMTLCLTDKDYNKADNIDCSLADMPPEIISKIMSYFNLEDPEYNALKGLYLSLFSKKIITKKMAKKSSLIFYKKLLKNSTSLPEVCKKLENKYNKLDKKFVHYAVLEENYKNILLYSNNLNFDYEILYKKLVFNVKRKRFRKIQKILGHYIIEKRSKYHNNLEAINNLEIITCLRLLKNNIRLFIIKNAITQNIFKPWTTCLFMSVITAIFYKRQLKQALTFFTVGLLGAYADLYLMHYKFRLNNINNRFNSILSKYNINNCLK